MKLQAPTSKLQRSTKLQVPSSRRRDKTAFPYPDAADPSTTVQEAPIGNGAQRHPFDLEERTANFAEAIVRFAKKVPRDPANNRLVDQLVGCGTSIGANYCEANEGVSKRDFRNTIGRCVKEAKETKYFLRLIATSEPRLGGEARTLYCEAKELHLIFASIFRQ